MESESRQSVAWADLVNADQYLDQPRKKMYVEMVNQKDGFVPPSVQKMLPEDVLEIEKAVKNIDKEVAGGIPSYAYFVRLLRKIQVLLVENAPDFFATLPADLQGKIRNAKIEMPTEKEVESGIFDPMSKSEGTLKGGFSFDMLVKDVMQYSDLSKKLSDAYYEYKTRFDNNKRAA